MGTNSSKNEIVKDDDYYKDVLSLADTIDDRHKSKDKLIADLKRLKDEEATKANPSEISITWDRKVVNGEIEVVPRAVTSRDFMRELNKELNLLKDKSNLEDNSKNGQLSQRRPHKQTISKTVKDNETSIALRDKPSIKNERDEPSSEDVDILAISDEKPLHKMRNTDDILDFVEASSSEVESSSDLLAGIFETKLKVTNEPELTKVTEESNYEDESSTDSDFYDDPTLTTVISNEQTAVNSLSEPSTSSIKLRNNNAPHSSVESAKPTSHSVAHSNKLLGNVEYIEHSSETSDLFAISDDKPMFRYKRHNMEDVLEFVETSSEVESSSDLFTDLNTSDTLVASDGPSSNTFTDSDRSVDTVVHYDS